MTTRTATIAAMLAGTALIAGLPGRAEARTNCTPRCANVTTTAKEPSIMPDPNAFSLTGDLFTTAATPVAVAGNGAQEIGLRGFSFQIGSTSYSSVFVNENGALSFGAALPTASVRTLAATTAAGGGFLPVGNLADLGVPVIAPFYADLASFVNPTGSPVGQVYVQYGQADPYADGGAYSQRDLQNAVRITWYGLTDVNGAAPVYAQVLLAGDGNGTNSFEFRYGAPGSGGGQAGLDSIAGFAFGNQGYQFTGPYVTGRVPTYFELNNGVVDGPIVGGVPEPATWLYLLTGFALIAAALRYRRRPRAPASA